MYVDLRSSQKTVKMLFFGIADSSDGYGRIFLIGVNCMFLNAVSNDVSRFIGSMIVFDFRQLEDRRWSLFDGFWR